MAIRRLHRSNGVVEMTDKQALRKLVFMNADATPKNHTVLCDAASVPYITAWYGAYCAGDRYTVAMDGRNVVMDHNGCPRGNFQ